MSNLCSSEEADETLNVLSTTSDGSSAHQQQPPPSPNKKRRKLPGNPDPNAKVIALSPTTLMATNRFICEVCNKGFQREQNLQLHRRGHNLPWKLKQKTRGNEMIKKRVYICPEISCIHHNPARALGDLTGIKKHFSRKHGEKKWKCEKCSKKYAVQSDWKAHSKTCGTKEYKCDCGTIFSRRDSFVTHRAFCDALTEENNKVNQVLATATGTGNTQLLTPDQLLPNTSMLNLTQINNSNMKNLPVPSNMAGSMFSSSSSSFNHPSTNSSNMSSSATLLLQQAAQMGATVSSNMNSPINNVVPKSYNTSPFNATQIPILPSDHDRIQAHEIGSNGFVGSMLQNSGDDHHQKTSRLMQIETGWYDNANNTLFNEKQRILNVKEGGHNNEDGLTLDFLGITGMTQRNLHEMHHHQQQMNAFEQQKEVSQQSIQVENSMWDD